MKCRVLLVGASSVLVLAAAWWWRDADRRTPTPGPAIALSAADARVRAAAVAARGFETDRAADDDTQPFHEPYERAAFHHRQRVADGATELPVARLARERARLIAREQALAATAAVSPGAIKGWQWLGPGNIGGRTRALVIDPFDPDVMYAAGVAGGIWKSLDGGASWNVLDDLLPNLAVVTLAMDPADSNVLYAGTGEGWYPSASVFAKGLGIYKTVDAGATWTQLAGTIAGAVPPGAFDYVSHVRISPNDSNRVYAATRTGVWRSTDAGATWSVVLANPTYVSGPTQTVGCPVGCTDLAVRADTDPDVLFAAFGSLQADGLYRSDDGGDTWVQYTVPPNQGRTSIALAPSNNDWVYLLMADNGTGGQFGQLLTVFRSTDGGATFQSQVDFGSLLGPWLLSNVSTATGCINYPLYSQGWYDNAIAVDPVNPNYVWVGGVDVFRSDDGGQSWGLAGYWFNTMPHPPEYLHADKHALVFHPDYDGVTNQTLFVASDGGLHKTDDSYGATSQEDCPFPADEPIPQIAWTSLNNGYGVTQFYHGDSAKDGKAFSGGAQDNGTSRVDSAQTPNQWDEIFGGDGGYVAIDPEDSQTMYVEYQGFPTIHKSVDGGQTFVQATSGITDTDGLFITPVAMDQQDPLVLWTGGTRPWRTTDGAASWQPAGPNLGGANTISAIAIDAHDGNVVYLGFDNGFVARTSNGLAGSPLWQVSGQGLPSAWISSVAIDPFDPDVAYATVSTYGVPHVYKSTNGGLTWTSIDALAFPGVPDIPVHWIAVRPCDGSQLYVGTELGVFASEDGGTTWQPSNEGLAHTIVESLDFRGPDELVAFTHGRGAYRTKLVPCEPLKRQQGVPVLK